MVRIEYSDEPGVRWLTRDLKRILSARLEHRPYKYKDRITTTYSTMVDLTYLMSTFLMGLFLLVILVVIARLRGVGRASTASGQRAASDLPDSTGNVPARSTATDTVSSETPMEWVIGFLLLVLAAGGGAVMFIGGAQLPSIGTQMAGVGLAVIIGGLVCGYFVSGIYLSLRSHGRHSAEAVGVTLWLLGLLGVLVIAAKLVFAS